ncbi:uncharacterized protein TrAtP1_010696 [Trichoderma atroviride]|uniref:uncharacterized protein n=1 Tax=Hypocrea atroviridis TaxID=63577 RepID=UPI003320F023|nr:hypothetical protein TrAtP1_010696 [Trichoderma atroviride]
MCPKCDWLDYDTEEELREHMTDEHNSCCVCNRCFTCPSGLKNHHLVHWIRTAECYSCHGSFASKSAVILHLEQGACESGVRLQHIDYCAKACHSAQWYLHAGGGYKCPTCDWRFRFMSALVQHVESDSCDEAMRWKNDPLAIFFRFIKTSIKR